MMKTICHMVCDIGTDIVLRLSLERSVFTDVTLVCVKEEWK